MTEGSGFRIRQPGARFRWSENAIAFWDNRCAQHRAMWDYCPHTRAGTRVMVKGERPV
jgi:taurine dioxygenase